MRRSVSEDFATEGCQRRWHRRQAGLAGAGDYVSDAIELLARIVTQNVQAQIHADRPPADVSYHAWREMGYTAGGGTVYTAPAHAEDARWWSYNRARMMWELKETDGVNTRTLWFITDEFATQAARSTNARIVLETAIRRRFGGRVPPIPTMYMD